MDNKIDFNKCNVAFFEENMDKIETTKFDDYNAWLGAMWRFKSLGISKQAVMEWCRRSSKFNQQSVDKVFSDRSKGNDNFEQSAKWFAKEARIQLPVEEAKAFNWDDVPAQSVLGKNKFKKVDAEYVPLKVTLTGKPSLSKVKNVMKLTS